MVGVGVHSAQMVCWGHDVCSKWHTCMSREWHGVCCIRCNRKRGKIVLESQGSCLSSLDLWETRSPKTRACVSTSGGMLGVVRDGNYNPIQGQTIQLCGTGGVTESARGTDSGHVEWTQSWAVWKTVACAEEEIGGVLPGTSTGVPSR